MLKPNGSAEWGSIQVKDIGGAKYVGVKDVLDVVANRAILMVRELAKPHQTNTHDDLLRGAIQELQQIEAAFDERHD